MKRLLLLAILVTGCDEGPTSPPSVNVIVSQVVGATSSPSPGTGACPPADRVEAGVLAGQVKVNSEERLDATAFVQGIEVTGICALQKDVRWSPFEGPCEFTTSPTGFNPRFRATAEGVCVTTVTVDNKSAVVTFRVVR